MLSLAHRVPPSLSFKRDDANYVFNPVSNRPEHFEWFAVGDVPMGRDLHFPTDGSNERDQACKSSGPLYGLVVYEPHLSHNPRPFYQTFAHEGATKVDIAVEVLHLTVNRRDANNLIWWTSTVQTTAGLVRKLTVSVVVSERCIAVDGDIWVFAADSTCAM